MSIKVSAINTNSNQNFSGVRKIVQCGPIDKIGDFLVRPVRELATCDGIDTTTKFFTPKGKFVGYHAVGKNGNVIGQRNFANGWKVQYWHDYTDREQQHRVLSVWINLTKATNKKPAKIERGTLQADIIEKNPRIIETKRGLLDFVLKQQKEIEKWQKKLKSLPFEDVTDMVL